MLWISQVLLDPRGLPVTLAIPANMVRPAHWETRGCQDRMVLQESQELWVTWDSEDRKE